MMKGVFYLWCMLLCTILGVGSARANNVRITACNILSVSGSTATVEVDIAWNNSWRTAQNWDAVWLFMKLKADDGTWRHAGLPDQSYSATGGFTVMNGMSGTAVTGAYVFRSVGGSGTASTKVTLRCNTGNYTKVDFDNRKVFLMPQVIEMVHIPSGAYYLGDGSCTNRLAATDGASLLVEDEDDLEVRVEGAGSGTVNLGADYPKGCAGFYVMKYELTQGQYVVFLNMLTRTQQESLLGSGLSALKAGEYLFGDNTSPTSRNGIVLARNPGDGACFFDHDLNGNKRYGEGDDGWNVACNYLSVKDLLAYASWSGLRPMNELEYESACRARAPWTPVGGEYAWNSGAGAVAVSGLNDAGRETETAANAGANVNSGNALGESAGPVRSGMFATASSGQVEAGAGYWGVMEMSGNLRDLVVGVGYTGFNRAVCGGGEFSPSLWSITPSHYGVRGGCFAGNDGLLMVSDRSEMTYVTDCSKRDATVGGRLVLQAVAGKIDPGKIALSGPVCPGSEQTVRESVAAGVTPAGGMTLKYSWYVSENAGAFTELAGESGKTLVYKQFKPANSYQFKRQVACILGQKEALTEVVSVTDTFVNTNYSQLELTLCNVAGNTFQITPNQSGGTYEWHYKGGDVLSDISSYEPEREDFGTDAETGGSLPVVCSYKIAGCIGRKELKVNVVKDDLVCPQQTAPDADGNVYPVVKIGCQCWMAQNMNVGTFEVSKGWHFEQAGIQKWCYDDQSSNCDTYGGLYDWWEVVTGGYNNDALLVAGVDRLNFYGEWELTSMIMGIVMNPRGQIQGICPAGWHLPGGNDLYLIGKSLHQKKVAQRLKRSGVYGWSQWCNGDECGKTGFDALPGGYWDSGYWGGFADFGERASFWTSMPNGNRPTSFYLTRTDDINLLQVGESRSSGRAVRCLKDGDYR